MECLRVNADLNSCAKCPHHQEDVGLLYSQARFCLRLKTLRHSPVDGGMAKNTKKVVVVLAGCWLF